MASWAPPNKVNPSATTSSLRLSRALQTFVETQAPPSLQTCAATTSRGYPLRPNTLASTHAARWWPFMSSRRPHRQVRRFRGRGRCNGWASILVTMDVGNAVKGADAKGPCWDRSKARWRSSHPGRTSSWMNLCSVCLVAFCCQPTFG